MKTLILATIAATLLTSSTLAALEPSPSQSPIAGEKTEATVNLKVTGMSCEVNCVKRVKNALTAMPGVISADVALPDKAVVKVDASKVDTKALIKAIEKAGYEASLKK